MRAANISSSSHTQQYKRLTAEISLARSRSPDSTAPFLRWNPSVLTGTTPSGTPYRCLFPQLYFVDVSTYLGRHASVCPLVRKSLTLIRIMWEKFVDLARKGSPPSLQLVCADGPRPRHGELLGTSHQRSALEPVEYRLIIPSRKYSPNAIILECTELAKVAW